MRERRLDSISNDREVSAILGENVQKPTAKYANTQSSTQCTIFNLLNLIQTNIDIKSNNVSILSIENSSEFYVAPLDILPNIIDHSQSISRILEKYERNCTPYQSTITNGTVKKSTPTFNLGDFIFTRFEEDNNWYRCFITEITPTESRLNLTDDGFLYEVLFVDYGNKQKNVKSSNCRTLEQIKASKIVNEKELNDLFNFPFQAICCELNGKKVSDKNTETLKTISKNFDQVLIKVLKRTKKRVLPVRDQNVVLEENQKPIDFECFVVDIYSDETKPLGDMFEPLEWELEKPAASPVKKLINNSLQNESIHECKIIDLNENGSFYIQLKKDYETIASLETHLNKFVQKIDVNKWKIDKPQQNEVVMAKLNLNESESSWYRAVITKVRSNNNVDVFYIDYGNSEHNLIPSDILRLPDEYSLDKYPLLAFPVQLDQAKFDLDKHQDMLVEILNEDQQLKIKIISHRRIKVHSLDVIGYDVELWDNSLKKCLNQMLMAKSTPKILILGATGVGKSYILNRILKLKYPNVFISGLDTLAVTTSISSAEASVEIESGSVNLCAFDTPGNFFFQNKIN
jgi:hypothetical protein